MTLTRIFSTFAQTGQRASAFVQDAVQPTEEQFFIKTTSGKKIITPERVGKFGFLIQ